MTENEVLTLKKTEACLFGGMTLEIPGQTMSEVTACFEFLREFSKEKIIYGINTGFGPMAQWRVDDASLKDLQYNIIRSHSTGAGQPLEDVYVKAAMIARLGTFLQARSGIHPDAACLLADFINLGIFPMIPEHGSVGASGDLVQLAHMSLAMIGEGLVHYRGQWREAGDVLRECGLKPLEIHIREGLALTNGTSVMTGIGVVNHIYAMRLVHAFVLASVWINEIASSFDDFMSVGLNECRRHSGQQAIASMMRSFSEGSRCLCKREHELYDSGHRAQSTFEHKVQPYYSLRCVPQVVGPVYDTVMAAGRILEDELNSASDNPIVDPVSRNVYHGGNFHGDYISLEEDKVKTVMVRLAMTAERQLNYLFHDRINGILPPFLNLGVLGLNYGMQACQFTATSTTAECQTLAMPNYVHSIPNNNDNQDIVSMGTNSALLCRRVIDNAYQVVSILYMALAQATDCLKIEDRLAPVTSAEYRRIRSMFPAFREDSPFYDKIAMVESCLRNKTVEQYKLD